MIEKNGANPIILTTAGGFSASVAWNVDDAMVFVDIDNLPNSPAGSFAKTIDLFKRKHWCENYY